MSKALTSAPNCSIKLSMTIESALVKKARIVLIKDCSGSESLLKSSISLTVSISSAVQR